MKHPRDTPLNQWSDRWLVFEVASLLDTPGYIMMSETECEREGYPSSRDQRVAFIASRREADAFLANHQDARQPIMCDNCGKHTADLPSCLCPGCEAYQEHQQ